MYCIADYKGSIIGRIINIRADEKIGAKTK